MPPQGAHGGQDPQPASTVASAEPAGQGHFAGGAPILWPRPTWPQWSGSSHLAAGAAGPTHTPIEIPWERHGGPAPPLWQALWGHQPQGPQQGSGAPAPMLAAQALPRSADQEAPRLISEGLQEAWRPKSL